MTVGGETMTTFVRHSLRPATRLPTASVGRCQMEAARLPRATQDLELMAQREDFELQPRARVCPASEGQENWKKTVTR